MGNCRAQPDVSDATVEKTQAPNALFYRYLCPFLILFSRKTGKQRDLRECAGLGISTVLFCGIRIHHDKESFLDPSAQLFRGFEHPPACQHLPNVSIRNAAFLVYQIAHLIPGARSVLIEEHDDHGIPL